MNPETLERILEIAEITDNIRAAVSSKQCPTCGEVYEDAKTCPCPPRGGKRRTRKKKAEKGCNSEAARISILARGYVVESFRRPR